MTTVSAIPASVSSITSGISRGKDALKKLTATNISILPFMCTRRVLMRSSTMTGDEMHGLAHRLKILGANGSLSSVLIARDTNGYGLLPTMTAPQPDQKSKALCESPNPYHIENSYLGYDVSALESSSDDDAAYIMDGLSALTMATNRMRKAPLVNMIHGRVADGGFALCMGRYILATPNARFAITNPSKGLSLDPCGLSYVLPRVGADYSQYSSRYSLTIAKILALTGYEASPADMVATGLATHYVPEWQSLHMLERSLGSIPPYDEQTKIEKFKVAKFPSERPRLDNRDRDLAVANVIEYFSQGAAYGDDLNLGRFNREDLFGELAEISKPPDSDEDQQSALVNCASTFETIFAEDSVQGIMEGLRGAQDLDGADEEYRRAARMLLNLMTARAPLALLVTYRLLQDGADQRATLDSCMKREKITQLRLLREADFQFWSTTSSNGSAVQPTWKHQSISEVARDELEEIFR